MADLGPRLHRIATATGALSPRQIQMIGGALDAIDALDVRQTALKAILDVLDPQGDVSRWALAQRLEGLLKRFNATARRRIETGGRPPTALESALLVMIDTGPVSARKLWTEVRELRG
jgi:hypothetical protein